MLLSSHQFFDLKIIIFSLLFCCFTTAMMAQNATVTGIILNEKTQDALIGANVTIQSEDYKNRGTVTDVNGKFVIENLPLATYQIEISYIGYENYDKELIIKDQNVDLGVILIKEDAVDLSEVEVVEQTLTAVQNGDTTQFNAKAFKVNPDANAEDLIRKMPGVVVQNGTVQAQGEDVKQVLVDGRPFFGNDPNTALKNLPAHIIDKIEVFDQQSEQAQFSGIEDDETTKTINIITKPETRNGQFGSVYGGYGTDNRYRVGGNLNLFNEDQRISILGQFNNINQQNFSSEDLLGVISSSSGSGRGRGRGRRGGGSSGASDFLVSQQDGISTTNAAGINYTDRWGEKVEVTGSYFYNQSDNASVETIDRTYTSTDTDADTYLEESFVNSINENHRFNLRLDYKINERNSLLWRPTISLQKNKGSENVFGQNFLNGIENSLSNYDFSSDLVGLNIGNEILYRHRFDKRGRTFLVNFNTQYSQSSGDSFLQSETTDLTSSFSNLEEQQSLLDNSGWTYSGRVNYTEPLNEKTSLQFNYQMNYQLEEADKQTFDFEEATQDFTDVNTTLSNVFNKNYLAQNTEVGLRWRSNGWSVGTGVTTQWADLKNMEVFPEDLMTERSFFAVLPNASIRYRMDKNNNFHFRYRASTDVPSVSQLQNVIDNSDPLQISIGNPDLEQAYQHQLSARYTKTNTEKSSTFYAGIRATFADNYVSDNTIVAQENSYLEGDILLQAGAQLIQPVNLDGYTNVQSFVSYGFPVSFLKSNLNLNLSGSYTQEPGIVDDVLNSANTAAIGAGITLGSNISEQVDFTFSTSGNLNQTHNTSNVSLDNSYYNQSNELQLNLIFGKDFVFRTNLNHQFYAGLADEFDQNYFLWNASIGKKILNSRAEINLSVFDILGQNTSLTRNVTSAYIEDVQTEVLQTYAMLNFRYNLQNFR